MLKYSHYKRVRYSETDKMGYLYYGHYAMYYEIGRTESLRAFGMSYKQMEDEEGVMLPVVSLESRYLAPAYYDDNIEIVTMLKEMPEKMITFHHELKNSEGKILNRAKIKLFYIDMKTGARRSIPDSLKNIFSPHFT